MKKVCAFVLAMLMCAIMLAACGGGGGGTSAPAPAAGGLNISLRVWGPQEEQELLKEMCDAFAAAHPENTYTFEYGVVSEADTAARYSEDPAAAGDIFMFPNDQLRTFVNAGGLYEVTRNKDDIIARNQPGSIESATLDGKLYGYPMTADNGYFLYYDKSIFSEEDVQTLDGMLEVASAAGKQIFMNVSDGWYIASFFLGNGGNLTIGEDGKQICDFNNANGLAAAEAIRAFCNSPAFVTGDDETLKGGMGTSIAAGVSGTWNAEAIQASLGDNYAATKLPTFTAGGSQVQMASFGGYKLIGVNSTISDADKAAAAMDLADWLTNEANQTRRFEVRQIGPSNLVAAESPAVTANIALAALAAQSLYALPQNDVLGGYWAPAEALGTELEAKSTADLQGLLDAMVEQIQAA